MTYSTTVDISALTDGTVNSSASVKTPIANIKSEIENLGNAVSLPEQFRLKQIATPSAPAASSDKLYFKSDDGLYRQTSAGSEMLIGGVGTPAVYINTARTALGAGAASVTISSIPATYKHLLLIIEARTDVAATLDNLILRFNADATAGNYYTQYVTYANTTVAAAEILGSGTTGVLLPLAAVGNTGAAGNGYALVWVFNYTSTTMRRIVDAKCGALAATSTGNVRKAESTGYWNNTSDAISSITFLPSIGTNLATNSAYTLYGFN